jgi:predicted enzyme related to lactoylglutathione lyase
MDDNSRSTGTLLHTAIIQTARMGEMAEFYGRGLDLGQAAATGDDHVGFNLPNAYFGFDLVAHSPEPTGVVSLWFEVDDIHAVFQRFEEMGARVKYSPTQKPWGACLAALYDPDGNVFGLSQRGQFTP